MYFFAVLATLILQVSDATIVTCEAPWLEQAKLGDILEAELIEVSPGEREDLVLIIDRCTDDTLRMRVSTPEGQHERTVRVSEIQEEARMRTIALAFVELIQEAHSEQPQIKTASSVPTAVNSKSTMHENARANDSHAPVKKDIVPELSKPNSNHPPALEPKHSIDPTPNKNRDGHRIMTGGWLRVFPAAKTLAPEVRLGIMVRRWRFDCRFYGMQWEQSQRGNIWLAAVTLTAGPTLWRFDGNVPMGIDALMEMGAVTAFGSAVNDQVEHTPKFNILCGAHLAFWIGIPTARRFQPTLMLEGGWIRGLNVFDGDEFKGGFEGPATSIGIAGVW